MNIRRTLLLWAGAWPLASAGRQAPAPVLILRHALTEPGVGDPPGYQLGRCETQRNLSPEGRAQARALGRRLAELGLQPTAWRSSRWCRCLDTAAEIAAGTGASAPAVQAWPALDSFFDAREREPRQTAELRERLGALRGPGFELWVTHQVNISALVSVSTSMGQALWLTPSRGDSPVSAQPLD
jgi:broad specificity phosphatase PhoE